MTNVASDTQITAPVAKAATALGSGAGASALSVVTHSQSFLPTDLAGWMALLASTVALVYTLGLLCEWWWKKLWRPFFRARGWITTPAVETTPAPLSKE